MVGTLTWSTEVSVEAGLHTSIAGPLLTPASVSQPSSLTSLSLCAVCFMLLLIF